MSQNQISGFVRGNGSRWRAKLPTRWALTVQKVETIHKKQFWMSRTTVVPLHNLHIGAWTAPQKSMDLTLSNFLSLAATEKTHKKYHTRQIQLFSAQKSNFYWNRFTELRASRGQNTMLCWGGPPRSLLPNHSFSSPNLVRRLICNLAYKQIHCP